MTYSEFKEKHPVGTWVEYDRNIIGKILKWSDETEKAEISGVIWPNPVLHFSEIRTWRYRKGN